MMKSRCGPTTSPMDESGSKSMAIRGTALIVRYTPICQVQSLFVAATASRRPAPPPRCANSAMTACAASPAGRPPGSASAPCRTTTCWAATTRWCWPSAAAARQTLSLRVGRDGMLLPPDLAPVPAAGRTLRELRADLESRAARELGGSEVFVSIGQVRQIAVFVGGEVHAARAASR